jgi:hypothetical protein
MTRPLKDTSLDTALRRRESFALTLEALLAREPRIPAAELARWIAERAPHDFGGTPATLVDRHVLWRMRAYGIDAEGPHAHACAANWIARARAAHLPEHIDPDTSA